MPGPVSAGVVSTDHAAMLKEADKLAKAGATYISPFIGRLDDIGTDGLQLIADVVQIYNACPDLETQVLVASVRHPIHVVETAKIGADVATLPPSVLRQMFNHRLTEKAWPHSWLAGPRRAIDL